MGCQSCHIDCGAINDLTTSENTEICRYFGKRVIKIKKNRGGEKEKEKRVREGKGNTGEKGRELT